MKYFIYIINCLLAVMIPVAFVLTPTSTCKSKVIKTEVGVKTLESGIFKEMITTKENEQIEKEENQELDIEDGKNSNVSKSIKEETEVIEEVKKVSTVDEVKPVSDVLEVQTGKMSGYGPDCRGCSGYLSSGKYVGDGNIYYNDSTYGNVRIVAADYSYKMGTIVRIKNSRAGNSILAIVLDRGGSIGFGKTFLFDLLYSSEKEAAKDEVSYNATFEILRYGY